VALHRFFFASVLFLLSACATIFTGTRDDITIMTDPPGALVLIDGIEWGRTPVTFSYKREAMRQTGKTVILKKEGYADRVFQLQKDFNLVSICNGFTPVFWVVDFVTGALFIYDPTTYSFTLEPVGTEVGLEPPYYLAKRSDGCESSLVVAF
jgi:hypothetical protein